MSPLEIATLVCMTKSANSSRNLSERNRYAMSQHVRAPVLDDANTVTSALFYGE